MLSTLATLVLAAHSQGGVQPASAEAWTNALFRLEKPSEYGQYYGQLLRNLPAPPHWPKIAATVTARTPKAPTHLRGTYSVIAGLLGNDTQKAIAGMRMLDESRTPSPNVDMLLIYLAQAFDENELLKRLLLKPKAVESSPFGDYYFMPELPRLAGRYEQAETMRILEVLMTTSKTSLAFSDAETRLLARQVFDRQKDKIKVAHSVLDTITSDADMDTYAELRKRTAKDEWRESMFDTALDTTYLLRRWADGTMPPKPRGEYDGDFESYRISGALKSLADGGKLDALRNRVWSVPAKDFRPAFFSLAREIANYSQRQGDLVSLRQRLADSDATPLGTRLDAIEQRAHDLGRTSDRSQVRSLLVKGIQLSKAGKGIDGYLLLITSSNFAVATADKEMLNSLTHLAYAKKDKGVLEILGRMDLVQKLRTPGDAEELFRLLANQGRTAEAYKLLKNGPWRSSDVANLLRDYSNDPLRARFPLLVARVLSKHSEKQAAKRILAALLKEEPGQDPAYRLYLDLGGDVKLFDELQTIHRFDERPVLWKGIAEYEKGRIDKAEKLFRQAIEIDPSDGDSPHGRRMLAYAMLAKVCAKKGLESERDLYERVVKAIRLSEKADDLSAACLGKDALKLYEESLDIFSNAYCIQSRLAMELAESGRKEEAAAAFKKAFSLMPDSFGRVETHCFGCEGVFTSVDAQEIAETVFEELVRTRPEKPQVHYLLGYLRASQDRNADAIASFKEAVRLDPQYVNAWVNLDRLQPTEETKNALTRLGQPAPRYFRMSDWDEIKDLATAWERDRQMLQRDNRRTPLYPLGKKVTPVGRQDYRWSSTLTYGGSGLRILELLGSAMSDLSRRASSKGSRLGQ